jgi:hypothetical protein
MTNSPLSPPKSRVIWRYLSLDKYLDLLVTKSIKFTQVAIAADRLETSLMLNRLKHHGALVGKEYILEGAIHHIDRIKKSHYISCWAGKEHECRSLWFAYLGESRIGVALKTTVGQVLDNIVWNDYGYDYREVVYRNDFDNPEELQINTTLLNAKAPAYISEAEIRFCVNEPLMHSPEGELSPSNPPIQVDPDTLPNVLTFDLDLELLINEIWLSPYCQDWQINMIRDITNKLAPELMPKMIRSDINERI